MKKIIIISLIAILGYSFNATSAMADCASRYGWGPALHFSISGLPPFFLPPPPPFYYGGASGRHGACRYGHYRGHHNYSHKNWKHGKRHGRKHHSDHRDNGKSGRSNRNQRHF